MNIYKISLTFESMNEEEFRIQGKFQEKQTKKEIENLWEEL